MVDRDDWKCLQRDVLVYSLFCKVKQGDIQSARWAMVVECEVGDGVGSRLRSVESEGRQADACSSDDRSWT